MKTQKLLIVLFLLSFCFTCFSQTKKIAHRSHSGKNSTFKPFNYSDNFGLPSRDIDSIIKISDKKIVEVPTFPQYYKRDTINIKDYYMFKNPKISMDSIRKKYPDIKFVGFDKPKKDIKQP